MKALLILPLLFALGCNDVNTTNNKDDNGNPVSPTTILKKHTVDFRVTGDAVIAHIVLNNSLDGQQTIDTTLPWSQSLKITTDTFLYLEAQSDHVGTMHVQIFVDGVLFREASTDATGFSTKAIASGTFRVNETAQSQAWTSRK